MSTNNLLAAQGVLVNLSLSMWAASKKDVKASKDLAAQMLASQSAVRVNKTLLDSADYTLMKKMGGEIRSFHYQLTSPYEKGSTAFLPTAHLQRYRDGMAERIADFKKARDAFVAQYTFDVQRAQQMLQQLYNPDDYPSSEQITAKCQANYQMIPVPDSGHFIQDAANEELEKAKTALDAANDQKIHAITEDAWNRLEETIEAMIDRLAGYDPKTKKGGFHGSLVQNIRDVVAVMDGLNVTHDPDMARIAREAKDKLTQWDAPTLKTNDVTRQNVLDAARNIKQDIRVSKNAEAITKADAVSAMF